MVASVDLMEASFLDGDGGGRQVESHNIQAGEIFGEIEQPLAIISKVSRLDAGSIPHPCL